MDNNFGSNFDKRTTGKKQEKSQTKITNLLSVYCHHTPFLWNQAMPLSC